MKMSNQPQELKVSILPEDFYYYNRENYPSNYPPSLSGTIEKAVIRQFPDSRVKYNGTYLVIRNKNTSGLWIRYEDLSIQRIPLCYGPFINLAGIVSTIPTEVIFREKAPLHTLSKHSEYLGSFPTQLIINVTQEDIDSSYRSDYQVNDSLLWHQMNGHSEAAVASSVFRNFPDLSVEVCGYNLFLRKEGQQTIQYRLFNSKEELEAVSKFRFVPHPIEFKTAAFI